MMQVQTIYSMLLHPHDEHSLLLQLNAAAVLELQSTHTMYHSTVAAICSTDAVAQ